LQTHHRKSGDFKIKLIFLNVFFPGNIAGKPKVVVKVATPVEEALKMTEVKQIASNQIKVTFNKNASANAEDAYKIEAADGTKVIGVKAVSYSDDGKSALITTYTNVDNGVVYNVSCGELKGSFTASVGEVTKIFISTANAQLNVKTPIEFTLLDANGIDVTPSVNVDSTCVITLDGSYVTAEKEKASTASVTMGQIGETVDVTITYNSGKSGAESVVETQKITCVPVNQTIGNTIFATTADINDKSKCAKFYLGLSDKVVAVADSKSEENVYFCAKDGSNVISYDKYEVESSNDDVVTVTVTKDSGKYLKLTVNGNSVGSANLNIAAYKNGVATAYSIPVQVSKGTTAAKMKVTVSNATMSNVKDTDYKETITAELLDANGKTVNGHFTFDISRVVSTDADKKPITLTTTAGSGAKGTAEIVAEGATPGTYAVKVTGCENLDGTVHPYEQNVSIQVKALPKEAYIATSSGINVTYKVDLSESAIDENPSLNTLKQSTTAKLYAVYNGLFAGYVNEDGSVSDEDGTADPGATSYSLNSGDAGIRVATKSAISGPAVTVRFGNQYCTGSAIKGTGRVANLYNPAANAEIAAITTDAALKQCAADLGDKLTINAVNTAASPIVWGDKNKDGTDLWTDVARTGTYYVEYYYYDVKNNFVKNPISQGFTVKNTLKLPTVDVLSKKVPSFSEDELKKVMKTSVDMNNNTSDYESIVNLCSGKDVDDGISSADGLKITYKYAIVEDNFGGKVWNFYVPINTTFSYQ